MIFLFPFTLIVVLEPVLVTSQMFSPWILSQIWIQRIHLIHLRESRMRGNVLSQGGAPEIASRMTVLWNGGGPYPAGRPEFNVQQDPIACRVLLDSAVTVWQIPQDVYARFEVSLAELALRVRPCGEVGAYLFQQLMDEYPSEYDPRFPLRTGGNWTLGDNTTASVLLENGVRGHWTLRPAPVLLPNLTYAEASDRKTIRVYHDLDVRFALEDFYSKLALCYLR